MIILPDELKGTNHESVLTYIENEWDHPSRYSMWSKLERSSIKSMIDIGANMGVFTDRCMSRLPSLKNIDLFEPDEVNFSILEQNFTISVGLHNFGIFYGKESGRVYGTGDDNTAGYMFEGIIDNNLDLPGWQEYDNKVFHMKELENIITEPVDLIKIDVEGSEYNIIENSTIVRESKFLIVEFHGKTYDQVEDYLWNNLSNYDILNITGEHYYNPYLWLTFLKNDNFVA